MIDPKDLRPFKASELVVGGIFYRKDSDGFHICLLKAEDFKQPHIRKMTEDFLKEGRLFVRISKPWCSFE